MAICYTRKTKSKRRGNPAFNKPLFLRPPLSTLLGKKQLKRSDVVRAIWQYAAKHNLKQGRLIKVSKELKPLFPGRAIVDFGGVAKMISKFSATSEK